jgi:hypothetical protein
MHSTVQVAAACETQSTWVASQCHGRKAVLCCAVLCWVVPSYYPEFPVGYWRSRPSHNTAGGWLGLPAKTNHTMLVSGSQGAMNMGNYGNVGKNFRQPYGEYAYSQPVKVSTLVTEVLGWCLCDCAQYTLFNRVGA